MGERGRGAWARDKGKEKEHGQEKRSRELIPWAPRFFPQGCRDFLGPQMSPTRGCCECVGPVNVSGRGESRICWEEGAVMFLGAVNVSGRGKRDLFGPWNLPTRGVVNVLVPCFCRERGVHFPQADNFQTSVVF